MGYLLSLRKEKIRVLIGCTLRGGEQTKIGYVSKRYIDGKENFKYIEGNGVRRIGVRSDTIKVKFLYGTIPYELVKLNTEIMEKYKGIILIGDAFFTDEETKNRLEKWCELANSCENREYSIWGNDTEE